MLLELSFLIVQKLTRRVRAQITASQFLGHGLSHVRLRWLRRRHLHGLGTGWTVILRLIRVVQIVRVGELILVDLLRGQLLLRLVEPGFVGVIHHELLARRLQGVLMGNCLGLLLAVRWPC
jgi:hypothetical protein